MNDEVLEKIVDHLLDGEVAKAEWISHESAAFAVWGAAVVRAAIAASDTDRARVLQAVALEIVGTDG